MAIKKKPLKRPKSAPKKSKAVTPVVPVTTPSDPITPPPTTVISTRISAETRKNLMKIGAASCHRNIAETVAMAIFDYIQARKR